LSTNRPYRPDAKQIRHAEVVSFANEKTHLLAILEHCFLRKTVQCFVFGEFRIRLEATKVFHPTKRI
jgi:hypothetical protein